MMKVKKASILAATAIASLIAGTTLGTAIAQAGGKGHSCSSCKDKDKKHCKKCDKKGEECTCKHDKCDSHKKDEHKH